MTVNKPEILRVLQEPYPEAKAELHFSNPYEMLVSTMLSAQCTDKQVNKVTPAVFRDFPNPLHATILHRYIGVKPLCNNLGNQALLIGFQLFNLCLHI